VDQDTVAEALEVVLQMLARHHKHSMLVVVFQVLEGVVLELQPQMRQLHHKHSIKEVGLEA
jgi:hypothetical protein